METTVLTTNAEVIEVFVTPQDGSMGLTFIQQIEGKKGRRTLCYSRDVAAVPMWQDSVSFLQYVLDMPEAQGLRSGWVIEANPKSGFFHAVILTSPRGIIAEC